MTHHPTAIASHRGGAFLWPENSLTAFRETARLRLEQAECDVHATADGDVVVMHDATLERTTDGIGAVAALTSAAFRRLRVKGCRGEAPPMLRDMLDALAGSAVAPRVEIKSDTQGRPYPGLVPRVLKVLDGTATRSATWIIAFEAQVAAEAAAAGGLAGVAWLLERATWRGLGMRGTIAVAQAYGFPEIGVHESQLDAEGVAALRAAGIGVSVWGANHEASIRRMLGLGVDVLTTDDPPLAIELRAKA
ncbi:glycerophosphodiester phosphodiesterase family protein [Roseomonas sp. CECT 9278]|uniref:glycerophosphodiester phosphodiesterase n=1 Tax=Roseomonas sp. CECT 9278 TaxID=2845823 RepID=UPI001E443367|nr:glycerophosphodiester phosphodiesterase family protein [Roseomonas sp. CECT 9278]CAH0228864.1 Glycerophosphodiester phosphodiesterase, cytoplasmic [Roseomonas sp. CECT 9278]